MLSAMTAHKVGRSADARGRKRARHRTRANNTKKFADIADMQRPYLDVAGRKSFPCLSSQVLGVLDASCSKGKTAPPRTKAVEVRHVIGPRGHERSLSLLS